MQKSFRIFLLVVSALITSDAGGTNYIFDKIEIKGNQRVDKQGILDYFPKEENEPYAYTKEKLDEILKELFKTDLFRNIELDISGRTLVVSVKENQFLNQIVFEGNKDATDDDLKSVVSSSLKTRQPFTVSRVREAEQSILALYRTKGRYGSCVTSEIIEREFNRVDLIFKIDEGPKAYIRTINFLGNKTFSEKTLSKIISSREERWYRFFGPPEEIYNSERLKYDEELLRQFYLKNGYADVRVETSHAELSANHKDFLITFVLQEGQRYKFGTTTIESEIPSLDVSSLRKEISWEQDEWFNNQSVQSACELMGVELCEKGISFIEVVPIISKSEDRINIKFVVRPTPHKYISSIRIIGNLGTDDTVIRRELTFAEGDPLNFPKILESEQNLEKLDFFESAEISDTPGERPEQSNIFVKVKEKSTGDIQLGGGYSTMEGPVAKIGLSERNFLGKGYEVHANGYLAKRGLDLSVGANVPHFMGRPLTVGANALYSRYREDTRGTFSKEGGYRQQVSGTDFNAFYALRKNLFQGWSYKIRRENLSFRNPNMSPYLTSNLDSHHNQWVLSLGHDLFYDRIEKLALEPVGGWFAKLSNEWSGVGGNIHRLANTFVLGNFLAFDEDKQFILRCEGRYGLIAKLGYMRFMDQFTLGAFSFPGFAESGVGPRDTRTFDALGGRQYYLLSSKFYFPLGLPKELPVKGILHAHAGSLWNPIFNGPFIASRGFKNRVTVGGGVICTLPFIGKFGIILSKALAKQPQDKRQTLLFISGQEF